MPLSFDDIIQSAHAELAKLQTREAEIDKRIRDIRRKNPDKPFNEEEKKELDGLRAELDAALATIEQVTALTLIALNDTEEIKNIVQAMDKITRDLQAKTAHLTAIGTGAQTVGDMLTEIKALFAKANEIIDKGKVVGA